MLTGLLLDSFPAGVVQLHQSSLPMCLRRDDPDAHACVVEPDVQVDEDEPGRGPIHVVCLRDVR